MSDMDAGADAGWCRQDHVDQQWERKVGSGRGRCARPPLVGYH